MMTMRFFLVIVLAVIASGCQRPSPSEKQMTQQNQAGVDEPALDSGLDKQEATVDCQIDDPWLERSWQQLKVIENSYKNTNIGGSKR